MKVSLFNFKSTGVKKVECPDCLAENDMASRKDDHKPKPGDVSICANCGCVTRFTEDMDQRRMTDDEIAALSLSEQEELRGWQRMIRGARKAITSPNGPDAILMAVPLDEPQKPTA